MPQQAYNRVANDLDTIRRGLAPQDDLSPHLARLLAACGGTLRGVATAARATDEAAAATTAKAAREAPLQDPDEATS